MALALQQISRAPEALDAWKSALAANPLLARARYGMGMCLRQLGRHAEACEEFRRELIADYGDEVRAACGGAPARTHAAHAWRGRFTCAGLA